jgi:hypothetical protein
MADDYTKGLEERLEKIEEELAEAQLYEDIVLEIVELADKEMRALKSTNKELGKLTLSGRIELRQL